MSINLNLYDNTSDKVDKTKTWVDVKTKTLFTREVTNRDYYRLAKSYNPKEGTAYFILFTNDERFCTTKDYKFTRVDDYGRTKVNLASIWNDTILKDLKVTSNIELTLVEEDNFSSIYKLDI